MHTFRKCLISCKALISSYFAAESKQWQGRYGGQDWVLWWVCAVLSVTRTWWDMLIPPCVCVTVSHTRLTSFFFFSSMRVRYFLHLAVMSCMIHVEIFLAPQKKTDISSILRWLQNPFFTWLMQSDCECFLIIYNEQVQQVIAFLSGFSEITFS